MIHDDGSLSQKYQKELPDLLPGCRVIGSKEAADFIQKRLQNHPLSGECRQIHPLCRKLFDIPLMTTKQKILMIDTDILFFRHPDQILNWLCEPSQHTLFMEDIQDATVNPAFDFARQKGFTMIPKVNTGIVGMNREIYDLDFFEECLAQTDMIKSDRWFIEQSLFALLSSIKGDVEFLDSSYHMELTPACPPDSVARHYMGKVRHLFYSEGIPIVKEMIQRERS
ncbi:hypothetical protein QQ056_18185 [Oscillatoria laete-virens NRMC-F 0139]|nr:hypothetical protein [Oscillatoria laete-virens]MDL5055462.1 hypothetical protein [Oscillatoria laete-virens NRMC-F 0139]